MSAPADHDARTRAIHETQRSVAISAGAGSGKTSVLVDRVVNVLVEGTPPERVAVITFTVKAAGELIARVRDALEDAHAQADGPRRATLGRVLAGLPRLTLSTIHAFCGELLRGEALAAGWAPGTEVLGEIYAPSAVEAGFAAWRADFMRRQPELWVRLLRELDVTDHKLEKAALCLLEHRDLAPALGRADPDLRPSRARLDALAAEIAATVTRCVNPGACKLLDKNRALLEGLATLGDLSDHEALAQALALGEGNKNGGAVGHWPDRGHERLKVLIDALRAWRAEAEPLLLEPIHHALVADLAAHFLPVVAEEKAASAQVDFQDLLFATLELLTRDAAASARLARRFDAILVDEVQDTDPIQSAIVMKLARLPEHPHDAPWHASAARPGGVFAVGDRAQSIYRFRRADVAQWTRLTELIARDGLHEHFVANFRSVPGIVGFVNAAFGHDRAFATQRAMREPAPLDPVVMLVADDGIDASVARYLRHVRRDGVVVDRHTRAPRPVRWRDIMVLVPAWTRADDLAATLLAAGVPAVVEGGRTFFDRDEVRLGIAALTAFDEPGHAEAIVLALRGLFGISLAELAKHHAAGGRWSLAVTHQPAGAVADALAVLRRIAARRGQVSWVTLLDDVLEATGAPAVWSLLSRGPSMLANVDKLRALIREIEAHTLSGGEVIARLTAMARSKVKDEEDLPLAGADSDVVRITSYFKAKGLEAPIVVLPHLTRKTDPVEHVVDRDAERLLLKIGKLVPAGWAEARAREEAERAEERRRWIYVAATRARDQLVVVRAGNDPLLEPDLASALPDPASPDDALIEVAAGVSVRVRHASMLSPLADDASTFPGHDEAIDHLLAADVQHLDPARAWLAARTRMIATAKRRSRRWRAVTTHAASARRGASPRGTSPDGREIGQAVHRAMQELDLSLEREARAAQASGLARAFASELGLGPDSVDKTVKIAARLARDPIVERARAAPEVWREVPFVARDGAELVSGRIDLLFPADATRTRWVVVDWKSELPTVGDPRRATYEAQLEAYARALIGAVGPHPVAIDKVLVGPPPELAPGPEDAWRTAEDEVAEELAPLLAALRAAGAPAPEVGLEIGEPVVASDVELVWEEAQLGLALDLDEEELVALSAAGWRVFVWPSDLEARREVARALAAALGLSLTLSDEETIA